MKCTDKPISLELEDPFTITESVINNVENGYVFEKGTVQLNQFNYLVVPDNATIVSEASGTAMKIYSRKELTFFGHPSRAMSIKTGYKYMGYCTQVKNDSLFLATFGEWNSYIEGGTSMEHLLCVPNTIHLIKRSGLSGENSIGKGKTTTYIEPPADCYWYGPFQPGTGWSKVELELDSLRTAENLNR